MEAITLRELLEAVGGTLIGPAAGLEQTVSHVDTDSRNIHPGSLFIPLVGERFDGHAYINSALEGGAAGCLTQRERESYRELILENIEYDCLIQNHRLDRDRLDELVELMVDTVCSNREMIRIAGDDYPAEVVKSRFLKLDSSHIEYVLDRMRENTTYVRNIKKYLLAALYNAPATIDSYYTSLVSHDLYGGGERR